MLKQELYTPDLTKFDRKEGVRTIDIDLYSLDRPSPGSNLRVGGQITRYER